MVGAWGPGLAKLPHCAGCCRDLVLACTYKCLDSHNRLLMLPCIPDCCGCHAVCQNEGAEVQWGTGRSQPHRPTAATSWALRPKWDPPRTPRTCRYLPYNACVACPRRATDITCVQPTYWFLGTLLSLQHCGVSTMHALYLLSCLYACVRLGFDVAQQRLVSNVWCRL